MKLTTALENFKGVVSDDLSFASVEIDKNCWLTLARWKSLCHRLSRDQPQPGSLFRPPIAREAEKRDPGNEVTILLDTSNQDGRLSLMLVHTAGRSHLT